MRLSEVVREASAYNAAQYVSTIFKTLLIGFLSLGLSACSDEEQPTTITGIVGSWYGFYPLYFANELNIPQKHNINLKLVEAYGALDLRRSYIKDKVQFFTVSMVEVSNAYVLTDNKVELLLATDYSNGGDVIIGVNNTTSVQQLQGKRIGFDVNSISQYVLDLALTKYGVEKNYKHIIMSVDDYDTAIKEQLIDGFVSYPPFSTSYLKKYNNLNLLYSTQEDPGKVFDTLMVRSSLPEEQKVALYEIWFETIEYIKRHPEEFTAFLAKIMKQSVEKMQTELSGIQLVDEKTYLSMIAAPTTFRNELKVACIVVGKEADLCETFSRNQTIWSKDEN